MRKVWIYVKNQRKKKNHEENDGSEIYHDFENSSDEKSQNLLSGSEDDD